MKKEYEIMGLKEGASKDEISKRYATLLKKFKAAKLEGKDSIDGITVDDVTRAYNKLMGYDSDVEPDPEILRLRELKNKGIFKKLNIDPEKLSNFWTYNKWYVISGIIGIIVIISFISSIVNRVEPDFNFAVVGEIYSMSDKQIAEKIESSYPVLKEVSTVTMTVGMEAKSEMDVAMQQKIMVEMAVGGLDLVIVDRVNYDRFAEIGTFKELTEIAEQLGVDMEKQQDLIAEVKDEEDPFTGLFGIYVTDSPFLKECGIVGDEMIATIHVNAKHPEAAFEVLKLIVKQDTP